MVFCSFCGDDIERGTGKTSVKKDSSLMHFCSRKCEKNLVKLKRVPLEIPWTYRYRKFHGKLKKDEEIVATEESKVKSGATPKFVSDGRVDKNPELLKEEPKKEEKK